MEDFSKVSTQGINQAKQAANELKAHQKAVKSADHSLRRKDIMPPTQAELKAAAKRQVEFVKEVNFEDIEKKRLKVKRQAKRYKDHFADRVKHCQKPAENAPLETWEEFLGDMQSAIGSEHAEEDFTSGKNILFQGIELASVKYPDFFGHQNLTSPVSLAQTAASADFDEIIRDERAEICILYEEWFSRGPFSRLLSNTVVMIGKVAAHNAGSQAQAKRDEGNFDHLVDDQNEEE